MPKHVIVGGSQADVRKQMRMAEETVGDVGRERVQVDLHRHVRPSPPARRPLRQQTHRVR